ncbi:NB-ARC domain-containing protein [Streptomyces sp. NPDC055952]|uniref:ATP-binding protein n=1 Tax=Streptomyces sp. NPDC055952 TaxID=3345663 RepID=UPI0035D6602B
MGKKKNRNKKKEVPPQPKNIVNVSRILGGAYFDSHHEEPHVTTKFRPAQLPARDAEFTGRSTTVDRLCGALEEGGAVALTGKPGVGKSALATEIAHRLLPRFPDAQLYVNLSATGDGDADLDRVLEKFLRALGFSGDDIHQDLDEKIAQYRSALHGRKCIVILDSLRNEKQARYLLPGTSSCATIMTSRYNLSGLTGVRREIVEQLPITQATELLGRVIGHERAMAEMESTQEIATLCGCLPLALRIAANRLRDRESWSLAHYAGRLSDERRRLELLRAGDLEVRASFSISYSELSESQKRVFRNLGVVPPQGFTTEIAAVLADMEAEESEDTLEYLVDANLIESSSHPGRYHLHDLLRVFAHERLKEEEGEERIAALRESMVQYYAVVAAQADSALHDGSAPSNLFKTAQAATDWFELEHSSLVYIVKLAHRHELHSFVFHCAMSMSRFLERRLHGNSWSIVSRTALESARIMRDRKTEILAILEVAQCLQKFPSRDVSLVALLDEANDLARELGSSSYKSRVLHRLGELAEEKGHLDEAQRLLSTAARLARQCRDSHQEGKALLSLADVLQAKGDLDGAEDCGNKARLLFYAGRDKHCTGNAWTNLSQVKRQRGDLIEADRCLSLAVRCYEEVHDLHCAGMAYLAKATVQSGLAQLPAARSSIEKARSYFLPLNDEICLNRAYVSLAQIDLLVEDFEGAISHYSHAVTSIAGKVSRRTLARNSVMLAKAVESGRGTAAAEPYWEEAMQIAGGVANLDPVIRKEIAERSPRKLESA